MPFKFGSVRAFQVAWALTLAVAAVHAQPQFKVLGFAPATGDLGHASYLKEAAVFFPKLAGQYGFQYDVSQDWKDCNAVKLAEYQVVIFLDNRPEDKAQRDAFQQYIENGGAWIGCHFAAFALNNSEVKQNWDWYHNTFLGSGEYVSNTWKPTPAFLKVEDHSVAASARLPDLFQASANEWYRWSKDLKANKDIKVLCSIDPSSYPLGTKAGEIWTSGYYPVVWTNTRYRMVYLNMGHNDIDYANGNKDLSQTFANDIQNRIMTDFILWAGGVTTKTLAPARPGASRFGASLAIFDLRGRALSGPRASGEEWVLRGRD